MTDIEKLKQFLNCEDQYTEDWMKTRRLYNE